MLHRGIPSFFERRNQVHLTGSPFHYKLYFILVGMLVLYYMKHLFPQRWAGMPNGINKGRVTFFSLISLPVGLPMSVFP